MKTLEQQFGKMKPKKHKPSMQECHAINNFQAIQALRYIVQNKCKLEHRSDLDSDHWKPGTIRELIYWMTQAGVHNYKTIDQFDTWAFNFWRIKDKPSHDEMIRLITIENNEED